MRHNVPIEEKIAAVRQAVRETLLEHALLGQSVVVMREGQIVDLSPEETLAELRRQEAELASKQVMSNG